MEMLPEWRITPQLQPFSEAVGRLHPIRLRALWGCAVEEAARDATEIWYPGLIDGLRLLSPLESLRIELLSIGHRGADPDPAAIGAALRIDEIIRSTRAAATLPGDLAAGARLPAALTDDPTATLGTTGP
jgi:hypothetical protein